MSLEERKQDEEMRQEQEGRISKEKRKKKVQKDGKEKRQAEEGLGQKQQEEGRERQDDLQWQHTGGKLEYKEAEGETRHLQQDPIDLRCSLHFNATNEPTSNPSATRMDQTKCAACAFGAQVQGMVASGADVNVSDKLGNTFMHHASQSGQVNVLTLLIETGANMNVRGYNGCTPIHMACLQGHVNVVQKLVESGADINIQDTDGRTPLHYASELGELSVTQILLAAGANLDTPDISGSTSLHTACDTGELRVVTKLLASGATNDIQDKTGNTPLCHAAIFGQLDVVELLTKSGVNIDTPDYQGTTALYAACSMGHLRVANKLIKSGANVNHQTIKGEAPLHVVSFKGHLEIAKALLESGSNVNIRSVIAATPLYMACQNGHPSVVQLLLSKNADVDSVTLRGQFPLWVSCYLGHTGVVRLLLSSQININACDCHGVSALFIACQQGYTSAIKLLLSSGADVNASTHDGISPLWIACQQGNLQVVQLLLESRACLNSVRLATGETALHKACVDGHLKIVELLVLAGADTNSPRGDSASPLLLACADGNHSIVQLLLSSGANVNASQTTTGYTPLYQACQDGHLEVVQLLLSSGANIHRMCNDGNFPLMIASHNGHHGIVQLLLASGAEVNAMKTTDGEATALFVACMQGHLEIVKLLLLTGADINRPCNFKTPLYIASQKGHYDIVRLLLSFGATVDQYSLDRSYPLHDACKKGHMEIVQSLCGAGADVNAIKQIADTTPLYEACSSGKLNVIQFLLEQQALPKGKCVSNNMSLLHAYCLSLILLDDHSEEKIYLFVKNFAVLLLEYDSLFEMSDYFASILDMLLLGVTFSHKFINTLIAKLGLFMAVKGRLDKPLYAILPETEATKGKLEESSHSLHTSFSAMVCTLDATNLKILLKDIDKECGHKQFLNLCNGLLNANILHIIPQYTCSFDPELVKKARLFLDYGVDVWAKDINGRLPLHIACKMGNTHLAECYLTAMGQFVGDYETKSEMVYSRKNYVITTHGTIQIQEFIQNFEGFFRRNPAHVNRMLDNVGKMATDLYIESQRSTEKAISGLPESIQKVSDEFSDRQTISQLQYIKFLKISNSDMEQLLYSSPRGKLVMSGENKLIFMSVFKLVETICDFISSQDPCFACKPVLSGSICEKTKTSLLDELDFCLPLLNFNTIAHADFFQHDTYVAGECTPTVSQHVGTDYWRLRSDGSKFFCSTLFCARFWLLLLKAISHPTISSYLSSSRLTIDDCKRKSGFVGTLSITWYGETFPCLPVSVDLVPVVELGDYYCLIRPRYFERKTIGVAGEFTMELSCNKLDKVFMTSLTLAQRDAYCLAKVIRGLAKSFKGKSGRTLTNDQVIQSYLLKTAFMWIIDPKHQFPPYYGNKDGILENAEIAVNYMPSTCHINEVRMWTVKIFSMLKHILQKWHKVHTYNLPLSDRYNEVRVRDKDLAIALCDKCIEIARPE